MKVIEHILNAKNPQFSFEIVPPPRGKSVKEIVDVVETLAPLNPAWIDVTSHASSAYFQENQDGTIHKKTFRKRPGSIGICGIIQNRFHIDTVAHILCQGYSKEETEDALIELSFLGIENVLVLKGDSPNHTKKLDRNRSANVYASDLVKQVIDLREGKYLQDMGESSPLNFCIGVAGYPEKHFEAANKKTDLQWLKHKIDQGADYIITQMFFNNEDFFAFYKQCREAGITVPIIPGLKVLRSENHLRSIPKTFHIDIPSELADEVSQNPTHAEEIGKAWSAKQVAGLISEGHQQLHFYVLNDALAVQDLAKKFR